MLLASVRLWLMVCAASAAILAYAARHSMNSDGLSYLDLATEALNAGPQELINGYWSPGYPALISAALWIFHPSPGLEFPLLHLLNFGIFLFALWTFSLFARLHWPQDPAFAYGTFLFFTLRWIGVELITPDLAVAAIVFLAARAVCLLPSERRQTVILGAVLAAGYYLKAAMLPLGLALLGILAITGYQRKRVLASAGVFLTLSTPLILAISHRTGRPSFGETGRLNYTWYTGALPRFTGWVGPGALHPPRQIMDKPEILEFATPVKGTYPLWYDPSYWYAGAAVPFDLGRQLEASKSAIHQFLSFAVSASSYAAGAIALAVFAGRRNLPLWMWAWPLAALGTYLMVHFEARFLGGFAVLFWLAIYGALEHIPLARTTVLLAALLPLGFTVAKEAAGAVRELADQPRPDYEIIAGELKQLGLQEGDRLAVVGYAANADYARYGRFRIVAEMPDKEFWRLSPSQSEDASTRLRAIGVNAVVGWNRPDSPPLKAWKDVNLPASRRFTIAPLSR